MTATYYATWAFIVLLADREEGSGLTQLLKDVTEPRASDQAIWLTGPKGGKEFFEGSIYAEWTRKNVPTDAHIVYLVMGEPGLKEVISQQDALFYIGITSNDQLSTYVGMDNVTVFAAEGALDFASRIMLDWNGSDDARGALFDKGKAEGMLRLADEQQNTEQAENTIVAIESANDDLKEVVLRHLPQYAMLPSTSVVSDIWTIDDRLGYTPFADAIAVFLKHKDTRAPLTVGIRAPWGAGKTSLMRMIRERLDPSIENQRSSVRLAHATSAPDDGVRVGMLLRLLRRRQQDLSADVEGDGRVTVWFNPWMYQTGEQIWAGLANEIITQVTSRMKRGQREIFWFRINLQRVGKEAVRQAVYKTLLRYLVPVAIWMAALVITSTVLILASANRRIISVIFGTGFAISVAAGIFQYIRLRLQNATDVLGNLVRWQDPMQLEQEGNTGDAFVTVADPSYAARAGFLQFVHSDVRAVLELVATEMRPLVVFIDDLDRCSPKVVAQVIEAVNAFLAGEFRNCLFVMAMEPRATVASIQVAYRELFRGLQSPSEEGPSLGWRFLDKLVQLPLQLPSADAQKVLRNYLSSLGQPVIADPLTPSSSEPQRNPEKSPKELEIGPVEPEASKPTGHTSVARPFPADLKKRFEQAGTLDEICEIADAFRREQLAPDEEVVQAATEVFDSRFRGNNPEVNAVVSGELVGLPAVNGREVKRFVNLFRFYAVIGVRRRLQGFESATISEAATLATLASRWPDVIGVAGDPEALTALRDSPLTEGEASDPRFGHIDVRRLCAISEYLQHHELSPGALSLLVG
jgi:hypothetical protein